MCPYAYHPQDRIEQTLIPPLGGVFLLGTLALYSDPRNNWLAYQAIAVAAGLVGAGLRFSQTPFFAKFPENI